MSTIHVPFTQAGRLANTLAGTQAAYAPKKPPRSGGRSKFPTAPESRGHSEVPTAPGSGGHLEVPTAPGSGGHLQIPTSPGSGDHSEVPTPPSSGGRPLISTKVYSVPQKQQEIPARTPMNVEKMFASDCSGVSTQMRER
jgi:hypothetical protein